MCIVDVHHSPQVKAFRRHQSEICTPVCGNASSTTYVSFRTLQTSLLCHTIVNSTSVRADDVTTLGHLIPALPVVDLCSNSGLFDFIGNSSQQLCSAGVVLLLSLDERGQGLDRVRLKVTIRTLLRSRFIWKDSRCPGRRASS